jgi:hypothetical protein
MQMGEDACAEGGAIPAWKSEDPCTTAEFDSLELEIMPGVVGTKAAYVAAYACQCDVLPLMFMGISECEDTDAFMNGDCTAEGMQIFGITDCDCMDKDGNPTDECFSGEYGDCPEDLRVPMTKEKMKAQLATNAGLEC